MVPKCEFCHAYASLIINSSEYIRFIKVNIHAQRTRYLACLQVKEFIFLLYYEIKVFSSGSLTSIAGVL